MSSNLRTARSPEAQAFRAAQVLEAAYDLASAGGYEGVQMREVARRAGVALATLYRAYPSKDDLLNAVVHSQLQQLRTDLEARPPRQRTPDGRAADVFLRAFRALTFNRGYAHAVMKSFHTPGEFGDVAGDVADTHPFVDLAALAAWGADHRPTAAEHRALEVVQAAWISTVISWLNQWIDEPEALERIRLAARRMLRD